MEKAILFILLVLLSGCLPDGMTWEVKCYLPDGIKTHHSNYVYIDADGTRIGLDGDEKRSEYAPSIKCFKKAVPVSGGTNTDNSISNNTSTPH